MSSSLRGEETRSALTAHWVKTNSVTSLLDDKSSLTPALCVPHANNGAVIRQPVTKLQGSFAHQHFWGEKNQRRKHISSLFISKREQCGAYGGPSATPRSKYCLAPEETPPPRRGNFALTAKSKPPTVSRDEEEEKREKDREVKENLQIMGETHRERERQNR